MGKGNDPNCAASVAFLDPLDCVPATAGGYAPDPAAPADGRWIREADGVVVGWSQAHEVLLADALYSWKGAPSSMRIHIADEQAGVPVPSSGSGKQMRAQAAALLWEIRHHATAAPRKLHRGSHENPAGLCCWSERAGVARHWASKNDGRVHELPKGTRGLRVADYITSSMDDAEREWIVEV